MKLFLSQSPDFYMEMKWEFTSWSKCFLSPLMNPYEFFRMLNDPHLVLLSHSSSSGVPRVSQRRVQNLEEWGLSESGHHPAGL